MHTKSYADIIEILKTKDPTFDKIITATKVLVNPTPSTDIYLSLLNSIVSQQLSVKVAKVIWQRFNDLFPASYPGPEKITQMEVSELRSCGLSNSKANYIKNVARVIIISTIII